ncbi:hypothetical protein MSG28_011460 [Choristoneura fumiferana]|uniref:Uncharacterized protein n=1 Tax=Choristoneura fumiferana TaxID=7141 RepID=A0ACC0JNB5_CHOFU|nr:hypothetical protein MSG28_011460 [Choristoneura fumiferana]
MEVTGLEPGHQYKFRVTAVNDEDKSEKPANVEVADHDNQSATVKWDPPANDGGAPILKLTNITLCAVKPRIDRTNLKALAVRAGKPIFFDVNVKGEPAPKVQWFQKWKADEKEVTENVINVDYNTKLDIKESVRAMTGTYRIVATNEHGKDEADVEITPVTGYVVEKLNKATGRWVPVGKTDDTEMEIKGLQEGEEYEFRVRAVNDEGESEPLKTDHSIVAKNPYVIEDWDVDRVDLTWEAPKNNGGAPITGYCKARVPDLKEGNTYQFRVRAVNKAGPGEPGEPTQPHVAKARFLKPWINRDKMTAVRVRAGTTIKLDVDIKGEPPPTKTWTFANKFRVKALNEEGESEPLETDHGTLAKNPYDVPAAPGLPDIVDWDEKSAKLKWEPPIRDNGAPITGYIIEIMDRDRGEFVKIQGNICQGTVPKLEEVKPRIDRTNLNPVSVKAGLPVSLDVKVFGEPPATVSWWFKGEELKTGDNLEIINVDYNTKFLMTKSKRPNTGKQAVQAQGSFGGGRCHQERLHAHLAEARG